MEKSDIESMVIQRAEAMFSAIREDRSSIFNKKHWIGKTLAWCMKNPEFKTRLFRFIDAFPTLSDRRSLVRHLREYFADRNDIPEFFSKGAKVAGYGGTVGNYLLQKAIAGNVRAVAQQFIIGENREEALTRLNELRKAGFGFTLDFLGEAVVSETEAEAVFQGYLSLLEGLQTKAGKWQPFGGGSDANGLDWGSSPKVNISVKPSGFYSQIHPEDFEGSIEGILNRLLPVYKKVMELGGFMCIDMESYAVKDLTLELYRRLRLQYPDYPFLGMAVQSYLKDTDEDLSGLIKWASDHKVGIAIRLVKGAYWDYEIARAARNNWPVPVYTAKEDSDAAYERHASFLLENHPVCYSGFASHNIRSLAFVSEMAKTLTVPAQRFEFQLLYGMAEPIADELLKEGQRVRLYSPYGEMVPGMAYLVRRLLENTANQSFLRHLFAEEADIDDLIQKPEKPEPQHSGSGSPAPSQQRPGKDFRNYPVPDFSRVDNREHMKTALETVRTSLGKDIPLVVNGQEIFMETHDFSIDPASPERVIGRISQAGIEETNDAVATAKKVFPQWQGTAVEERAGLLRKAAAIAREKFFELAAWQVFEVGKPWEQACADVCEGIDFLEYYARKAIELGTPADTGSFYGETNQILHAGKGVAAVIAPWNFPFAISAGMVSAALVAGNTVIYKPSERSPVTGYLLSRIFQEAGLPPGVLNFVSGPPKVVGNSLVEHPDVCLIAFTGSLNVGLQIIEKAGIVRPGQEKIKKVVAEMGGKNAIIIDDDADLDEAVPAVIQSAFGFQGQKCSACSRVIVLASVYARFVDRLLGAVRSLRIGPAEDPGNTIGPVIDQRARDTILAFIEEGQRDADVLFRSEVPDNGFYVPATIFGDVQIHHRIANEEIFGPVLAVMKAENFEQAIDMANATRFALTGGVFSRSPVHIALARKNFQVGNLYVNRGITGALVGRQPFGGFRMSGLGGKAGGEDYLLNFVETRSICENTLRKGFAPEQQE